MRLSLATSSHELNGTKESRPDIKCYVNWWSLSAFTWANYFRSSSYITQFHCSAHIVSVTPQVHMDLIGVDMGWVDPKPEESGRAHNNGFRLSFCQWHRQWGSNVFMTRPDLQNQHYTLAEEDPILTMMKLVVVHCVGHNSFSVLSDPPQVNWAARWN